MVFHFDNSDYLIFPFKDQTFGVKFQNSLPMPETKDFLLSFC